MQNTQFGSKNKNIRKTSLETQLNCLMQKTVEKTANIKKFKSILKMPKNGHNARRIAHAKYSVWVKK